MRRFRSHRKQIARLCAPPVLAALLAGCGSAPVSVSTATAAPTRTATAVPTPTIDVAQKIKAITQRIDAAERIWKESGIASYRMTVDYVTFGADVTMLIEVRDGQIASHSCASTPDSNNDEGGCDWLNDYPVWFTVPGLFSSARDLVARAEQSGHNPFEVIGLGFDEDHGYPASISWHLSEPTSWEVMMFAELP